MPFRRPPAAFLFALLAAGCTLAPDDREEERREGAPASVMQRWQMRLSADGSMPDHAIMSMKAGRDAVIAAQTATDMPLPPITWQWRGPGNVGGRIRELLIHPTNPARMWAGSAGGGVWRTDNAGALWQPLNSFLPVLGIGCMALDPSNPLHLYIGTGEGFFDAVQGSSNTGVLQGAGVFESFDGGDTWAQIATTATPDFYFCNRIAICPGQPSVILMGTSTGIWRSTDAGATWSQRTTTRTLDVKFHPTDPLKAVAGRHDSFAQYTLDGGLTWQLAVGPTTSTRVELAYAPGDPNTVYCSASNAAGFVKVWRSGNGGQQYTLRTTGNGVGTYSLYNNCIWVDPTDLNRIAVGAVQIYRSIDGGVTLTQFSTGAHPDYHVIREHPSYNGTTNRQIYTGDDGGVHVRTDLLSGNWTALNNNLGITQFYGAAINNTSGTIVAGAQDNGTHRYTGNPNGWSGDLIGGDGAFCAADPTNANYFYGEYQYLQIQRSSNGGSSFSGIVSGILTSPQPNFMPYFMLDPNDANRMLACSRGLWRTNNVKVTGQPTWAQIKPARTCLPFTSGPPNAHFQDNPPCNISTCNVALGNSDVVWVGHNDGELHRTANGTAVTPAWTMVDGGGGAGGLLPDRWISSICIDPQDHQRVYVTLMGYELDNVWRTTDNGVTWQQITGTAPFALPRAPVSWLLRHPRLAGWLFAGTDVGLFISMDDGATWTAVTDGPGPVAIDQLIWRDDRRFLAVTHGRGIFEGTVLAATTAPVGTGCGVGPPVLTAAPPVLGQGQLHSMTAAPANAAVFFGYSFGPPVPTPIGACTILLDLPNSAPFLAGTTDGSGAWSYTLAIPLLPVLAGNEVTAQALALVSGGPLLGAAEVSNGVLLTLGF